MSDNKSQNAQTVLNFINAWTRLDAEEIAAFFTEDGTYHNMPIDPVSGRETVKAFVAGFINDWKATNWDVLSLVAEGETVIAERVDHIHLKSGKSIDLPCLGIFEMEGGKIKVWRDYFDMNTYVQGAS